MRLEYTYDSTANNGNVRSQQIQRSGDWSAFQCYNYDSVNRLAIAAEGPSATTARSACTDGGLEWCNQYSYDFFDNRAISDRVNSVTSTNEPTSFNLANNRVGNVGWGFHAGRSTEDHPQSGDYLHLRRRRASSNGGRGVLRI